MSLRRSRRSRSRSEKKEPFEISLESEQEPVEESELSYGSDPEDAEQVDSDPEDAEQVNNSGDQSQQKNYRSKSPHIPYHPRSVDDVFDSDESEDEEEFSKEFSNHCENKEEKKDPAFVSKLTKYYIKNQQRMKKFYSAYHSEISRFISENANVIRAFAIIILLGTMFIIYDKNLMNPAPINFAQDVQFECADIKCKNDTTICLEHDCFYCFDKVNNRCSNPIRVWQASIRDENSTFYITLFQVCAANIVYLALLLFISLTEYPKTTLSFFSNKIQGRNYSQKAAPIAKECIKQILQNDVRQIRHEITIKGMTWMLFLICGLVFLFVLLVHNTTLKCPKEFVNCEENVAFCKPADCSKCLTYIETNGTSMPNCGEFLRTDTFTRGQINGFAAGLIIFAVIHSFTLGVVMSTVKPTFTMIRDINLPKILDKKQYDEVQPELDAIDSDLNKFNGLFWCE